MNGVSSIIKLIVKLFIFVFKKLRIQGVLLLLILMLLPVSLALYNEKSDEYQYEYAWEIVGADIEQVEKTDERCAYFSESQLDENYGKVYLYEINFHIRNTGSNDMRVDYETGSIEIKDDEGHYISKRQAEYYSEMDSHDRISCEAIPSGKTVNVTYYMLIDEGEIPETLHFYKGFDEEEILSLDLPYPS